ncbi:unnamed protein product [Amoebophrya sp. A25]|nr:unnamed protein product [Amoebophrya sp. A25]|eukprot:GSA25T00014568001.1
MASFQARPGPYSPERPEKGKGKGKGGAGPRFCFAFLAAGKNRGQNCGVPGCQFRHELPATRVEAERVKTFAPRVLGGWNLDDDFGVANVAGDQNEVATNNNNNGTG